MAKISSGLLLFRKSGEHVEVLLGHPGGPFWGKKDVWSIPKGELEADEDHLTGAAREFEEELGFKPPTDKLLDLGSAKANGSKTNFIWAVEHDPDLKQFHCRSSVSMQWPPNSGKAMEFPEIDRIGWFDLPVAKQKLFKAQAIFIDRLAEKLGVELNQPEFEKPITPEQSSLF